MLRTGSAAAGVAAEEGIHGVKRPHLVYHVHTREPCHNRKSRERPGAGAPEAGAGAPGAGAPEAGAEAPAAGGRGPRGRVRGPRDRGRPLGPGPGSPGPGPGPGIRRHFSSRPAWSSWSNGIIPQVKHTAFMSSSGPGAPACPVHTHTHNHGLSQLGSLARNKSHVFLLDRWWQPVGAWRWRGSGSQWP